MRLNVQRHSESYKVLTSWLKDVNVPYLPCNSAPFVLAKIAPDAQSWEEEAAVIQELKELGVWVSPGRSHHMPEYAKGWARITFALEPAKIEQALARMKQVLLLKSKKV